MAEYTGTVRRRYNRNGLNFFFKVLFYGHEISGTLPHFHANRYLPYSLVITRNYSNYIFVHFCFVPEVHFFSFFFTVELAIRLETTSVIQFILSLLNPGTDSTSNRCGVFSSSGKCNFVGIFSRYNYLTVKNMGFEYKNKIKLKRVSVALLL